MSRGRRAALGAVLVLALPGCTSFADTVASRSAEQPAERSCPASRAQPDPDRPRVTLDFRLGDDRRTVTGTETVVFTPDRATGELVFRLVPNGPDSAAGGNALTVEEVRGADVAGGRYERAAAAGPGGLYVVRLARDLRPGDSTEVTLDFRLALGRGGFDRFGTADGLSWWGSGAPLLAWQPGVGWAEDPFVDVLGETTTSPAADTTVRVSAPAELTVLMTGAPRPPSAPSGGRRTWTATEPAARDVAVAAGEFATAERTTPSGVRLTTGTLPRAGLTAQELADRTAAAIGRLEQFFGPFPYRTLAVPLLPDYGGGIEYPSAILEATPDPSVLVHEVAHMWFYGMVGNSQFREPWLDEAFATWAEALTAPGAAHDLEPALRLPGPVGASMAEYPSTDRYFALVYGKGAAALLAARAAAGPQAFDAAIRCYVDANAWRIATPRDVGVALADLPEALLVLARARALEKSELPR